ncbi:monovalent cation/H(+) antiporter subunit G [Paramaledivibacter caminithermalis]|jgi:multicomponent Na+:H+ antiporter subunit G|uniref:Multisubunit sodium/proton antiporter, MrpG subunit (TC 2.A.63.1) n=1 Tax=Paramaledivibacter caminithermalis (strain DSM 15212 / CIP 107654 / DViRD3) TaxID=1121301 RepID=A0A1M6MHK1_PARC5|nr:monovalent cation/H(+) antiporter subunit G [Paramaledivibacter caminithermalis]SHJ82856.1 multisubunit sodium/proton antiporter, MrpG subunit (TC 2.A.63.1) [Paramaledivibacter caminithermalis DSM 15212]
MIVSGLLILSWIYILFGIVGIFRFSNMYSRLLTSSKIDTVASITILLALIFYNGFSVFSLRLFLILIFVIITCPISNHVIARSAYLNGIIIEKEGKK